MAKPVFDPTKSFEPVTVADARVVGGMDKPAFNPDQEFSPVVDKVPMSMLDAAKVKGAEGATLGLSGLAAGVGAAAGNFMGQQSGKPTDWQAVKDAFKEGRQGRIDLQNQAQEEHPKISAAANIGGSLITAPLIPAKGLAGAVGAGTAIGAAQAAGSANDLTEAATDIGGGALGGALAHGAVQTGGKLASSALSGFAENKAYKAAGAMLKDFRAAFNKDPQKINELGRTMLDNGLVKMGDDVGSIAQKSEALRRQTGQKIGDVYDKVLENIKNPENLSRIHPELQMQVEAAGFHPEAQADEMKAVIAQKFKGQPGSTGAINKANQIIDELAVNGNHITPQHALELKGSIDSMINWSKRSADLPIEQDALKEVRTYIQNKLNNQVSALDKVLQSKDSQELVRLNKLYGNVATVANVARDRALRESANQSFGLGDKMMAMGGLSAAGAAAASGHGLLGVGLGLGLGVGNKLARTYGNAAASSGAELLSRGVVNPGAYIPSLNLSLENLNQEYQNANPGPSRTLSSVIKPKDKLQGR